MLDTFQGREGSVLNLSDTLVIRSLFLLLILLVAMTEFLADCSSGFIQSGHVIELINFATG